MTDKIKRGDLKPDWQATLLNGTVPVDLSTATSIVVNAVRDGSVIINRRVITGGPPFSTVGVVTMPWQAADTASAGDLYFEVEVMWPGSKPQTFPADDYLRTRVFTDEA